MKYKGERKLCIGSGTQDIHSKPVFFTFLAEYFKDTSKLEFTIIGGLKHEVTEPNEENYKLILG